MPLNAGLMRWQQAQRDFSRGLEDARIEWERVHADELKANRKHMERERVMRAKSLQVAHGAKRRAAELKRTAAWADLKAIAAIYNEAKRRTEETGTRHHVDHVIPLQGRRVSGLHVENNLQILTEAENCAKHNRFDPC